MRLASLLNLAFSTGGLLLLLFGVCAWLLIRPRSLVARLTLRVIVVWYTVISIYPIPHGLALWWGRDFAPLEKSAVPPGRVAVVLLGSGSYTAVDWTNGRVAVPDPIGLERTLEAARVYNLINPAWVISSGGLVEPHSLDVPPGEVMKDALLRLGVPASRVMVKDQARDTHDEAMNVAGLLPALRVDHIVLVTSVVHMRRASATFRAAGLQVIPAPAREDKPLSLPWQTKYLPTERGLYEASLVAHEVLGFVYYGLRGWR